MSFVIHIRKGLGCQSFIIHVRKVPSYFRDVVGRNMKIMGDSSNGLGENEYLT